MHFYLTVVFSLASTAIALVVSDLLEVVFVTESSEWRSAALADGKWDRYIRREAVFMNLFALISLYIAVSRKRATVIGVERRLTAHVLWACGASRSCRS